MTSLRPKRLNFREMWQLHKIVKDTLPKQEEEYLIMEVIKMMENMNNVIFKDVLYLMYGDITYTNKTPSDLALMFIKGIKKNNLFPFESFLKSINP